MPTSDFRDLFACLNAGNVRYLIVGGYAVMRYTEPRYTKDIDVWIDRSSENADATYSALARFGAPLQGIKPRDLTEPDIILQLGVAPVRVDILTSISGVAFGDAWNRRVAADFAGVPVFFISKEDLIAAKRASGRPEDLLDLKRLED